MVRSLVEAGIQLQCCTSNDSELVKEVVSGRRRIVIMGAVKW